MFNIEKFKEDLSKYGLTLETYDKIITDIDSKIDGENDYDWSEIKDKYGINCNSDTIRKSSSTPFGGKMRSEYERYKAGLNKNVSDDSELDVKIQELRKERIKLQTANVERTRLDRAEARQEMYYEHVGQIIKALPIPNFEQITDTNDDVADQRDYILTITDIHFGAEFSSENNKYSKEIALERFEYLLDKTIHFIKQNKLTNLKVTCLGDSLQGLIHLTDLKINDSSIVKSCVEISRIIANFVNQLSRYVNVEYYHVPSANHTQTRGLGSRPNELMDEDLEYLIGNYIKDLLSNNKRITVILAEEGKQYVVIPVEGYEILAMHGHQIKSMESAIKDLSMVRRDFVEYLLLGHFHAGKSITCNEGCLNDAEILVAPSFIGSDPYSDSLFKGSKAACMIYGFNSLYGHVESHKIILN